MYPTEYIPCILRNKDCVSYGIKTVCPTEYILCILRNTIVSLWCRRSIEMIERLIYKINISRLNLKLNRNLITSSCVEFEKHRIEYDRFVMVSSIEYEIEISILNLKLSRNLINSITSSRVELEKCRIEYDRSVMVTSIDRDD